MKKIFKGCTFMAVLLLSFILLNVDAKEVYYTNLNGVEMTNAEYEKISNIFSENKAAIITQEEFDKYKNLSIVDSETIFVKTVYKNDVVLYDEIVSEEEYNNASEDNNSCGSSPRSSDNGYYETGYKRLSATLLDANTFFSLLVNLHWKIVPVTRSYDVIAFRTTHMSYSFIAGTQTYYIGTSGNNIYYNSNSQGYNGFTNGAGFSMNLKDGSNITGYDLSLNADLHISEYNYLYAHVFTTYQHAQSDLTRAQSMSYTLQAGGLGDVVYYSNTTIRNKYDGMAGIELITPI